ncbi:MAG TPA: outer membrane beta-barrel protein [Bryobacteraceae bacterium]|nr:outer membrane beta-barrel protein [Bryobacteraceae bacterium]
MRYSIRISFFALAMILAPALSAQDAEVEVGEVTGFFGGVFGVGSHPTVGAGFAYPTSRHLVPNAEFSYAPLGGPRGFRSNLWDFNGGVQVRFPGHIQRLAPYVGVGIGLVHVGGPFGSDTDFAVNLSGGARYYLTENLGIRPEIKGFLGDNRFTRFSLGVFWQFQ